MPLLNDFLKAARCDWNGPLLHPALAGTQQLVLSAHPKTHEGSMLVRYPKGWKSP